MWQSFRQRRSSCPKRFSLDHLTRMSWYRNRGDGNAVALTASSYIYSSSNHKEIWRTGGLNPLILNMDVNGQIEVPVVTRLGKFTGTHCIRCRWRSRESLPLPERNANSSVAQQEICSRYCLLFCCSKSQDCFLSYSETEMYIFKTFRAHVYENGV